MPHDDLERIVDRALKRLPTPRAPHTLLPRVMAARAAQTQRVRPFLAWPIAWQVASVATLLVLALGVARLWSGTEVLLQQSASPFWSSAAETVGQVTATVTTTVNVGRAVWRALVEPFVGYVLVLILVMCAACATGAAALGRVAVGELSQSGVSQT
jgi:hypothetical protein